MSRKSLQDTVLEVTCGVSQLKVALFRPVPLVLKFLRARTLVLKYLVSEIPRCFYPNTSAMGEDATRKSTLTDQLQSLLQAWASITRVLVSNRCLAHLLKTLSEPSKVRDNVSCSCRTASFHTYFVARSITQCRVLLILLYSDFDQEDTRCILIADDHIAYIRYG
jgi:hypothetical protein